VELSVSKGLWRGLQAIFVCTSLAGCGWFGGNDAPVGKARPGADCLVAPTGTLPSASPGPSGGQGVAPTDETRSATQQIGSIVTTSGGQRAQREAAEKDAAERDAKVRDRRRALETSIIPEAVDREPAQPKS